MSPADQPTTPGTTVRRARRDHPLLVVNTGHGKGKSTAAFGIMLRGWARGYRVGI